MTDPFVQRMMARSQARRGQNKENSSITDSTRQRLKQLHARYSDEEQPPKGPLLTSNSDISEQPPLMIRNLDASPKNFAKSPVKEHNTSPTKRISEVTKCPSHSRMNVLAVSPVKQPSNSADNTKGPLSPSRPRLNALISWNDDLQKELEAQGFTPTESRSKLYYNFKPSEEEETPIPVSPSKVKGMSLAEFMRNSPPCSKNSLKEKTKSAVALSNPSGAVHANYGAKKTSPAPPPPPPVILACHPKSPASSPVRSLTRVPSPEPQYKDRKRDVSPSKVGEMRSRWEQHIRDASPTRTDRSRSPIKPQSRNQSPIKFQSTSCMRPGSPVKDSSPHKFGAIARQISQEKVGSHHMTEHKSQRDLSPVKDEGLPTRFKSERKSRRELSPHRPPPVSDIVKGETPMPEAVPLVSNAHMSSVRARAAAFDSARGPREPEKDPAERSVQERRAMFTKHQGGALVPKAPFGQSVPAKSIQSSGSGTTKESSRGTSVVYSEPVQKPTKKMASGPSPVKSQQTQEGHRSPSPSTVGSQRMRFENIYDNWRENEINSKIQAERQKDMDVLFNRFKRPKPQPPQAVNERGIYNAESETEYVESDESYAESTASDDPPSGFSRGTGGPPKPPRLYLDSVSPGSSTMSASPPLQPPTFSDNSPVRKIRSPASRLNSTEINESRSSPKKEYIPKIKPGCLFPSLSDIESHSEAPDSQDEDEVQDSSFAESILTCASVESLGQKIKQAAQANMNKQLSTIAERSEIPSTFQLGYTMSDSTLDAIEAIDNAIDEALYDEATPPKRQRSQENEATNVYKTPKIDPGSSRHDVEDQTALAHSISMYRKQKPDVPCTPVRQIVRHPDLRSPTPEPPESPSVTVSARIKELQEEVAEQQRVIAQASNAVTVVLQRVEHQGTPQHVEAEKLLLLATQKRQTALDEIQRLKTEGALSQHSWAVDEDTCRGSISISNISVPLKQDFLKKGMNGNEIYHLIVLVKHREQVISSQLLATPLCVVDGSITFPNLMSLHSLTSDFTISLEVYALRTLQERQMAFKKEQSRMKLTPLKRLQKSESKMASPFMQSPGGPYAVRSSSFQLVGFTHLNISTLTRNAWTLEKVPFSSPLDGHLLMRVSCSFEGGIVERGFLTMFEDIGGFGSWNRRWCLLSGMFLRYWRYPDDENKKEAIGQIDLRSCTTRRVELVSRDICARQHTFQLICLRPTYSGDVSNLVQEIQGSSVVTKHLLSADSKEERIRWCNKLNKSLANIRAWDPDALRPEDYQV